MSPRRSAPLKNTLESMKDIKGFALKIPPVFEKVGKNFKRENFVFTIANKNLFTKNKFFKIL
jgi:hypothetical protein